MVVGDARTAVLSRGGRRRGDERPIIAPRKATEKPLPGASGLSQFWRSGSASLAAMQSSSPSWSKRSTMSLGKAFEKPMKEPNVMM